MIVQTFQVGNDLTRKQLKRQLVNEKLHDYTETRPIKFIRTSSYA